MMTQEYVQYGCGLSAPEKWRNFDASPTLRLQRLPLIASRFTGGSYPAFPANVEYGDIVAGLPVPDRSCAGMYCSHVLEHLALSDLRTALRNTRRHLAEGGTFRLVLPDLEHLARDYLASSEADAAGQFMRAAYLGVEERERGPRAALRGWLGNSTHLWMWDYKSLREELLKAGFTSVRRAEFGDAKDHMFAYVEDPGRWKDCLGIECS